VTPIGDTVSGDDISLPEKIGRPKAGMAGGHGPECTSPSTGVYSPHAHIVEAAQHAPHIAGL